MLMLGTHFSIVLGLITGVVAAWRRGTLVEKLSVWVGLAFFSLPTQWLAIMLILYLAGPLGLPTNAISDPYLSFTNPGLWAEFTDRLSHMVLPSLTLGLVLYGEYLLITRSALLETFGENYVLTARAKGLSTWRVVRRHALRNSLLPITTLIFLSLGFIAAGSILIEWVHPARHVPLRHPDLSPRAVGTSRTRRRGALRVRVQSSSSAHSNATIGAHQGHTPRDTRVHRRAIRSVADRLGLGDRVPCDARACPALLRCQTLHTREVLGSIPSTPTLEDPGKRHVLDRRSWRTAARGGLWATPGQHQPRASIADRLLGGNARSVLELDARRSRVARSTRAA
jgi:hypothetical protein